MFLSHLHSDHHADLASLYVNAMFGRKVPLEIWGPSSEKPELGLAASIEGLRQVHHQNLHSAQKSHDKLELIDPQSRAFMLPGLAAVPAMPSDVSLCLFQWPSWLGHRAVSCLPGISTAQGLHGLH